MILGSAGRVCTIHRGSPEFFAVFGVEPVAGRFFTLEEVKPGASRAAIIRYAYWQSHLGGDPPVLGKTIRAAGPRPIVGVLPPGFRFPDSTDIWIPSAGPPGPRTGQNYLAVGRLKAGVAIEQAQTEMRLRCSPDKQAKNRDTVVAAVRLRDQRSV